MLQLVVPISLRDLQGHPVPEPPSSHQYDPVPTSGTHIFGGPQRPPCPQATLSQIHPVPAKMLLPWMVPTSPCLQDHPSPCQGAPAPISSTYIFGGPTKMLQFPLEMSIWGHPGPPSPHRGVAAPTGGTHVLWDPRATSLLPERLRAAGTVATGWHCGTVPELSPGLMRGCSPASHQPHATPGAEPPDPLLCPDGGPRHAARHRHHAHRRPLLFPRVSPGMGTWGWPLAWCHLNCSDIGSSCWS